MAMLGRLRNLIHDNSIDGETHFSDSELNDILEVALIEVNIWAETSYADITTLEAAYTASPSGTVQKVYLMTLYYAQIKAIESDASAFGMYTKMVTQDATIDPGDAGTRLDKILKLLKHQFEERLKNWFGIMDGGLIWASAGETEF